MNEFEEGLPEPAGGTVAAGQVAPGPGGGADRRPSLTTQVRRRRTDQQFFLRLRDAIQQNHKALERLGT
jgi:hypothetical protein